MTPKKLAALLTAFSFFNFSTSPLLLAGPREDNRYFSYQPEVSQAVYNSAKDVSHPAYELNHLIETQKQSRQLELNLRQVLRDQRPVLSEGQSMFTPVPTPKTSDLKPEIKPLQQSLEQNLQQIPLNPDLKAPDQNKPIVSAPSTTALPSQIPSQQKGFSAAIKSVGQAIATVATHIWQAIKAPFAAIAQAFKALWNPTAKAHSIQQASDYSESIRAKHSEAQSKLSIHQKTYTKLQDKANRIGQHVEVLKNEYKRLGLSNPQVENAIQSLGKTETLQKLSSPLQALAQKSQGITEAITSHNFTRAEKLLNDFNQSEQIYSKVALFVTRQINQKTAVLLHLTKNAAAIAKDPQQAHQAAREALDHLRHLLKQELITPQAYAPLRVALTKSLPLQMAEAEKIKTREDIANAKEAFVDIWDDMKEISRGDLSENPSSLNIATQWIAGCIPGIDQIADRRDFYAALQKGDGVGIVLAGVGSIPMIGNPLKTAGKAIIKHADKFDDAVGVAGKAVQRFVPDVYDGAKRVSQYLRQTGVPRDRRIDFFQKFEVETMKFRHASPNEYGIRYFDNMEARERGHFLFDTFPASRKSLAIKEKWNQMLYFKQWRIKPDAVVIEGRAKMTAPGLEGGKIQKFVPDLDSLEDITK